MKKKLVATLIGFATTLALSTNAFAATVNCDVANVRTGGSTDCPIVGQLGYGSEIEILGAENGWYTVNTPFGIGSIAGWLVDTGIDINAIARQYYSLTNHLVLVDTMATKTYVFTDNGYGWELEKIFDCAVGASCSPTVCGEFFINYKRDYLDSGATWEYNVCDFAYDENGEAYCFHSTLYMPGTYDCVDDTVNAHISNGCVRLHYDDSRWIFDNCQYGTKVVVF